MRRDLSATMREMRQTLKAQHTREYPEGRLSGEDEGSVELAIGSHVESGKVLLVFADAVTWAAIDPDNAEQLAASLSTHAKTVRDARRGGSVQ